MEGTNIYCNRCNQQVTKSDLEEYNYQCMECDEDLYRFETHTKQETNT